MKYEEKELIALLKNIYFSYWFQKSTNILNLDELREDIREMLSFLYSKYDKINEIMDNEKKNTIIDLMSINDNEIEISISIIKESLFRLSSITEDDEIKEKILYLETKIKKYLTMIKEKTNIDDEMSLYFDILGNIQAILARYSFKYGISLNETLNKFIYDFDRIDDLEYRNIILNKIKREEELIK